MATLNPRVYLLTLLIHACFCHWSGDRRFSDLKRCADEECSMLLTRGKAAKDFTGPDCRFLSFKKEETIYVYYKLSGQRSDMWAGSVGNHFGYFPKDYLNINHIYTEKEFEVPAEETDFVCFDSGLDKFDSYDLDVLLGNLFLIENENLTEDSKVSSHEAEFVQLPSEKYSELDIETEYELKSHRETESLDSKSHRETNSLDSELAVEKEPLDSESLSETASDSESHKDTESEDSESHKDTESEDSESHKDTESEASESVRETESEDSESHRETESEDSDSHRETESEDSDSHREIESEDSESHREIESEASESHGETESEASESHGEIESEDSESHRETESEGSESHRETESEGSESHREIESEDSESVREIESEDSESVREIESEDSESHREIESEDSESVRETESEASESVRETESEDSESHKEKYFLDPESHKETDSLDSELLSRKASDSESHRERESLDSESLSETEKQETDKLESPENHTEAFISMGEESDSFQPKTGGKSSETAVESKEEPEKKDPETITVPDDLSLSKDEDVETEPSVPDVHEIDQSELHNKSHSESQSDSENIIEAAVEHKNQISDSKEEKRIEPLNTEDKPLQTEEKTLEMLEEITEDEDVWSTIKEEERIETVPLEEITKDQELEESHAAIENLWKSSSEEQVEEDTDSNVTDTPTADPTKDSNDAEPKSYDFPTEAESAFPSVNTGESYEDDPKTHETEKENTAELQMNINENANKKNTEYNDPQDAFPNKDENIEGANSKKSITNKSTELRTSERSEVLDDQINKVKNQLENLMKNTLESEQQRPEDENEDGKEDTEELLDDENALFASSKPQSTEGTRDPGVKQQEEIQSESESSDTNTTQDADESRHNPENEEPVYSDSVLRLTILRDHLKDEDMERFQKYLSLKNLFKLEAMFSDLDHEMLTVRTSQTETEDVGNALDRIMEASENSILDETEEMLSKREQEHGQQKAPEIYDLEAAILDSFQEIVFSLRQKYSAAKESIPLLDEEQTETEEQHHSTLVTDSESDAETVEPPASPEIHEEHNESELTLNPELIVNGKDLSQGQDVGLEEDGGHFNRNKDTQTGFEDTEDIQKGPQAMLENPLDIGLRFETDPSSGSLKIPSVSDAETDTDISSSNTSDELRGLLRLAKEYLGAYTQVLIAALPEEWRPGPTFHGVPWEPVLITAAVGLLTVLLFFWRTVLAIKGRTYQLTEKQLREKIQQLLNEKSDAVNKISELNAAIKEREEKFKNSERNLGSSQQEMKQLKTHHRKLQSQCEEMSSSISQLNQNIIDTQEENSSLNEKIVKMHQRIGKYQQTLKNFDEERAKVHVLMDEAKYREDALKAQVNSFEKENNALKEQKKSLLRDAKGWQEKHEKLSEDIRLFHKSQKDLEDSLVHKENEIDVLSGCIAELTRLGACDAVDSPNEDAKMSHGDEADKKMDTMRLRIKQMMDVSRIKATLCVVEEERNRYMESLLTEQKSRQELEEQYQKVMHDQMNLKNDKTHLENQFKNLQQRLEITTELYQQKENALQQKLTQEELERREKETKLSEVDSKALRSEDELRAFKQKIRDIEEEMQQNEQTLKNEVAIQEKKAHENWLKARASERALVEERRESATLRQKLVECSDKIADLEQSMFKLNSAPPDRHMPSMRRGDSYGPSPVSGGAPSPPLMIEGPGRPPSAPVGRRSDSFGPRPPSDPHGRFSELGHPMASRAEMFPPMTSSPCAHDGPMQTAAVTATAEASEQVSSEPVETLSKSQNQGSFLPSPIRDSPVPPLNAPLKSYGPPMMGGPIPPNGPPPLMIRPPNGHPPMMPPGPGLGPEPRFRPPDSYGPPPPMGPFGPVPPPFARGPPLRDLPPMGPLPPPRDLPPDFYGPRGLPLRPFPPGSLPPPGVMAAPPYGGRGFAGPRPLVAQSSRDVEGHVTPANNPATDRPSQDAEP